MGNINPVVHYLIDFPCHQICKPFRKKPSFRNSVNHKGSLQGMTGLCNMGSSKSHFMVELFRPAG